ncbi:MAG: HD domain-containing protein [Ferrovum sp.]|nr:HD domain-containing protein [Ferrovum sp.]
MSAAIKLDTREDAYALLQRLGATPHLLMHLQLVGEAADELIALFGSLGVACDAQAIELGAALHDAGKIVHQNELSGPGHQHEKDGQQLLLAQGVPAELAHHCVSHAAWDAPVVSFEELAVALADALWKGVRIEALELRVIDASATQLGVDRWTAFTAIDDNFELIANRGPERLARSRDI